MCPTPWTNPPWMQILLDADPSGYRPPYGQKELLLRSVRNTFRHIKHLYLQYSYYVIIIYFKGIRTLYIYLKSPFTCIVSVSVTVTITIKIVNIVPMEWTVWWAKWVQNPFPPWNGPFHCAIAVYVGCMCDRWSLLGSYICFMTTRLATVESFITVMLYNLSLPNYCYYYDYWSPDWPSDFCTVLCRLLNMWLSVADPGFSRGGAWTLQGGVNTPNFPENCMKSKEFGHPGGRASLTPPLDPPMTVTSIIDQWIREPGWCS